jgi:dCMP deaminase
MTHCTDGGCPRAREQTTQGGSYANCVAVHAEQGAIVRATYGSLTDGTLYVNGLPCWECAKTILSTRLARVVFLSGREPVDKSNVLEFLSRGGIEVVEVDAVDLD